MVNSILSVTISTLCHLLKLCIMVECLREERWKLFHEQRLTLFADEFDLELP